MRDTRHEEYGRPMVVREETEEASIRERLRGYTKFIAQLET